MQGKAAKCCECSADADAAEGEAAEDDAAADGEAEEEAEDAADGEKAEDDAAEKEKAQDDAAEGEDEESLPEGNSWNLISSKCSYCPSSTAISRQHMNLNGYM